MRHLTALRPTIRLAHADVEQGCSWGSHLSMGQESRTRRKARRWQERQDSNPRPSVLETDALPI